VGVFLILGQHLERAQDGQARADQGEELLVEDEEGLQLDLAPLEAGETGAGADGEDVIAAVCTCSCTRPRSSANLITNSAMPLPAG
jgi:hypothetical protein